MDSYNGLGANKMSSFNPASEQAVIFDKNLWTNQAWNDDGMDCNGNTGPGRFCYCPSQGFNCACKYNPVENKLKINKWMCYDHYGFDCQGKRVDGESNWCSEENNQWTAVNKRSKMNL